MFCTVMTAVSTLVTGKPTPGRIRHWTTVYRRITPVRSAEVRHNTDGLITVTTPPPVWKMVSGMSSARTARWSGASSPRQRDTIITKLPCMMTWAIISSALPVAIQKPRTTNMSTIQVLVTLCARFVMHGTTQKYATTPCHMRNFARMLNSSAMHAAIPSADPRKFPIPMMILVNVKTAPDLIRILQQQNETEFSLCLNFWRIK